MEYYNRAKMPSRVVNLRQLDRIIVYGKLGYFANEIIKSSKAKQPIHFHYEAHTLLPTPYSAMHPVVDPSVFAKVKPSGVNR